MRLPPGPPALAPAVFLFVLRNVPYVQVRPIQLRRYLVDRVQSHSLHHIFLALHCCPNLSHPDGGLAGRLPGVMFRFANRSINSVSVTRSPSCCAWCTLTLKSFIDSASSSTGSFSAPPVARVQLVGVDGLGCVCRFVCVCVF